MTNAGTKALGCFFFMSVFGALAGAVIIVLFHGDRVAYVTTALAGALAVLTFAGYVIVKAVAFARSTGQQTGARPSLTSLARLSGACDVCKEPFALWFCVPHSIKLCRDCSQKHHQSGHCYYSALYHHPVVMGKQG